MHQPIVSPNVASLVWTVTALLIILIGGVGTLSGALVGAAVFRLLEFYLDKWFGEIASFLLGAVYIALVLFVPFYIFYYSFTRWDECSAPFYMMMGGWFASNIVSLGLAFLPDLMGDDDEFGLLPQLDRPAIVAGLTPGESG